MVNELRDNEIVNQHIGQKHIGGFRWRFFNATWPFATLTMGPEGIAIKPSSSNAAAKMIFRVVRFPGVNILWDDIDRVEEVRGILPMSHGVYFATGSKRLIWWCKSTDVAEAVMAEVSQFVASKVVHQEKRRLVL